MKKPTLTLCLAAACLLANGAFAQTRGEVDPAQSKAAPSKAATKTEKEAARKARQAEGKQVAKTAEMSDKPESAATRTGQTADQRKKAAAERRAKNVGVAKEPKVDKSPN